MKNLLPIAFLLLLSGTIAAQTPTPAPAQLPQPALPTPKPAPVVIPDPPVLPVKSAILIEQSTGQVIADQGADD